MPTPIEQLKKVGEKPRSQEKTFELCFIGILLTSFKLSEFGLNTICDFF